MNSFENLVVLLPLIMLILCNYIFIRNFRNNIVNIFIFFVFYIYLVQTPTIYWFSENYQIVNVDVKDYFAFGMFIIFVWMAMYLIGYKIAGYNKHIKFRFYEPISVIKIDPRRIGISIITLNLLALSIITINTYAGGVSLLDVMMGIHGEPTLGLQGYSYYLQNLADSLIILTLIYYYFNYNNNKLTFVILILLNFSLFAVLGFRYRIILVIFGMALIFLIQNKITIKNVISLFILAILFLIFLLVLTANRVEIFMQNFDAVTIDLLNLPYEVITDQAKGSLVDFALYKAYFTNQISNDLGETWFGYIFVKLIPSFLFTNGVKPYPPPQLVDIDTAINAGREVGEAVTILGGSFYAFNIFGICIAGILLGYISRKFQSIIGTSAYNDMLVIVFLLSLFQLITRGYFPQFVDHFAYMILPVLILGRKLKLIRSSAIKIS